MKEWRRGKVKVHVKDMIERRRRGKVNVYVKDMIERRRRGKVKVYVKDMLESKMSRMKEKCIDRNNLLGVTNRFQVSSVSGFLFIPERDGEIQFSMSFFYEYKAKRYDLAN